MKLTTKIAPLALVLGLVGALLMTSVQSGAADQGTSQLVGTWRMTSLEGNVAVDEPAGTFVMTVESAAVRDLTGHQLPRAFTVSRDTLVLAPTDPTGGFRATYGRL